MLVLKRIKYNRKFGLVLIRGFLLFLILNQPVVAQEIIWFSNVPPTSEKNIVPSGMHRLSSIKGKRGQSSIIQWFRKGNSVERADYFQMTDQDVFEFYMFSPSQEQIEGKFVTKDSTSFFTYASKEEGYYNAYFIEKEISGDTLYVGIAKSEMLNHSCRNGHKNVRKIIGPHVYPDIISAEITREREFTEDFHYFATSSDEIEYQLQINGKAVKGANLTFVTQTNWHKTLKTNKDGFVTFQIIQDYFSPWQELNNRKIYYYLIYSEITLSEKGVYNENEYSYVHYTTSLSDGYRPAKTMYMSMFWALVLFILTVVVIVSGVFIHRLRRFKVYKEIKLDEKN